VDARAGRRVAAARHHEIDEILQEALEHESTGLDRYRELLEIARDASISLEEYARKMIASEEMHVAEVQKMLRRTA
jgi:bacterioferritin